MPEYLISENCMHRKQRLLLETTWSFFNRRHFPFALHSNMPIKVPSVGRPGNPTFVEITSSTFFDNHMLYFFRRFCVLFSTWNGDYFIITDMIFIICTFFDFKHVDSIRQIKDTMYFIRQLCTLLDTVQCTMYFIRHHVIHISIRSNKLIMYYGHCSIDWKSAQ